MKIDPTKIKLEGFINSREKIEEGRNIEFEHPGPIGVVGRVFGNAATIEFHKNIAGWIDPVVKEWPHLTVEVDFVAGDEKKMILMAQEIAKIIHKYMEGEIKNGENAKDLPVS